MIYEEIQRLNSFIDLNSPASNKQMIKTCIFLNIATFFFVFGNSFIQNFNLLTSWWMVFAVFALLLIIWGVVLIRVIEKRQIDFLLFWASSGTYYSIEFFSVGISYGRNVAHISIWFFVALLFIEIFFLLLLFWYRVQLFKGKMKIRSGSPNYRLMFPLILILSPIGAVILKTAGQHAQDAVFSMMLILVGYVESVHLSLYGNYFIAKKYQKYVYLYDERGVL